MVWQLTTAIQCPAAHLASEVGNRHASPSPAPTDPPSAALRHFAACCPIPLGVSTLAGWLAGLTRPSMRLLGLVHVLLGLVHAASSASEAQGVVGGEGSGEGVSVEGGGGAGAAAVAVVEVAVGEVWRSSMVW